MKKYYVIFFFVILILAGIIFYLQQPRLHKYSESKLLLGTIVKIDVCVTRQQRKNLDFVFQEVWKRIEDIHERMGEEGVLSEVRRINLAQSQATKLQSDTYGLLRMAVDYSQSTQGAFDVTVLPLLEIWRKAAKINRLPEKRDISEARKDVGFAYIKFLPPDKIRLTNKNSKIVLGAVAKGYAVDEAARLLRKNGFYHFLIDAGGDLYASGNNDENLRWRIGIRHPLIKSEMIDRMDLSYAAITTSGDYEQYFEIQGQKYSHIIDPKTGYPTGRVVSATVIAPTTTEADILSTALCVLDPEKGIAFIDSLGDGFSALIFEKNQDGDLVRFQSRAYEKFKAK
ncbi:MAG: FAD:protein FMN transferase [Candidatus Omnitrophota bacterium]